MGNLRNRACKPSQKGKATKHQGIVEKQAKFTDEKTQQSDAGIRPDIPMYGESPLS